MRNQLDALELDDSQLPSQLYDAMPNYSFDSVSLDSGMSLIMNYGASQMGGLLRGALQQAVLVVFIVLLCGLAETFYEAGAKPKLDMVSLAGTLAVTTVAGLQLGGLVTVGREAIESTFLFSKGLLASVAAATAAVGAPVTAAGKYAAVMLFSDGLITVIDRLLTPVLFAYIAVVAANAAIGEGVLERLAKFLKWTCVTLLGGLLSLYITYITVSGAISGGADALTVKAAKSLISSAVPVVGGIISDATETILASATVVRNSAGLIGIFSILALCLVPFLQIALQYLMFRVAGALSAPLSGGRMSKLIDDLAGAFGILTGMVGTCALLMLISVVSFIRVTGV